MGEEAFEAFGEMLVGSLSASFVGERCSQGSHLYGGAASWTDWLHIAASAALPRRLRL